MTDSTATTEASVPRRGIGALSWLVIAVFGLLYAYDLWEALANLFGLAELLGWSLIPTTLWLLLAFLILVPIAVYPLALRAGRRRSFWQRGLILLAGWALVSVLTLSAYAFLRATTGS